MLLNVNESKEIMKAVEEGIANNSRKEDFDKIMSQIRGFKLEGSSYMNQINNIIKRYFTTKRTIAILLDISANLRKLIDVDIYPKLLEVSQGEELAFKVKITNNSGIASKFRVTAEQDNKNTPTIYDPKKNLVDFRREVEFFIDSPQTKVMNLIIKPEMIGIRDLDKLKKEGHVDAKINVRVESIDVVGLKNQKEASFGIFK